MMESLKNRDFSKVYRKGKSTADDCLVLYILENGTDGMRLGITVSKKIGNSVIRSRVKRIIREAVRAQASCLAGGYDYVFIARGPSRLKKSTDLEPSVRYLAERLRVYRRSEG